MLASTSAFRWTTTPLQGVASRQTVHWQLLRRGAWSVCQLSWIYMALGLAVSAGVHAFDFSNDTRGLALAALLMVAVGAWFLRYARHAQDGEKIVLQDGQLVVELTTAGREERAQFNSDCVRIEPHHADGSLIEVFGQGRRVRVGRHLPPAQRPALAREIREALRAGQTTVLAANV